MKEKEDKLEREVIDKIFQPNIEEGESFEDIINLGINVLRDYKAQILKEFLSDEDVVEEFASILEEHDENLDFVEETDRILKQQLSKRERGKRNGI